MTHPSKVAVLTNDLQYDLVTKTAPRESAVRDAIPGFVKYLNEMRDLGSTVFHLQLINRPDDPNIELHEGRVLALEGSDGAKVMSEFVDNNDVVVQKNSDSGFYETTLNDELQKRDIEVVVITGMQTQICVQVTASDALFRGYNVWVPEDCVVSALPEDKTRSLDWMKSYCATISTGDEIIDKLRNGKELARMSSVTP